MGPEEAPDVSRTRRAWLAGLLAAPLTTSCGTWSTTREDTIGESAWARAHRLPATAGTWTHRMFPQRKPVTYLGMDDWRGRPALHAAGAGANSLVRVPFVPGIREPGVLTFSWWTDSLNARADVRDTRHNDVCLRWVLSFDGDRSIFTARDRAMSELALLLTGEPLPHATLMYIWDAHLPAGSVLPHPNTSRIRFVVVRSGTDGLGRWNEHRRHVADDFARAFDEPRGALQALAAFTNSNNTGYPTQAWYGPVALG